MPKKNYVRYWGCRPQTTGARRSDECRSRTHAAYRAEQGMPGVRTEPWVCVSQPEPASTDRVAACTARPCPPPLAFSIAEQDLLLGLLGSERFVDMAPAAVFATLLDEGQYYGSIRTMYRLLAAANQSGERRRQRIHPVYTKPELLAVAPNEVWSWDITKIRGPVKWS